MPKLGLTPILRGLMHAEWIGSLLEQLGWRQLLISAISSGAIMLWDILTGGGSRLVTGIVAFAAIYVFLAAVRVQKQLISYNDAHLLDSDHRPPERAPLAMPEDDRTLAHDIEHFYKAYLKPAADRINELWIAVGAGRLECQHRQDFMTIIDQYMFKGYSRSFINIDLWFTHDSQDIDRLCVSAVDMLDNYFARYMAAKALSVSTESIEFSDAMRNRHDALCANLHTLITAPSSRKLYNIIQRRDSEWLKELHS